MYQPKTVRATLRVLALTPLFFVGAQLAGAQATTTPNTGAGANLPINLVLISTSLIVLGAGSLYLRRALHVRS